MPTTNPSPLDIYKYVRPLLFRIDAERAHHLAIAALKYGLVGSASVLDEPVLKTNLLGMTFAHPIGLAAGFDKHAEVIDQVFGLGFSFAELGGVTPLPQEGNPKPRLFRLPESEGIINRFGFNSVGADLFSQRLQTYRHKNTKQILGVNLGKNKQTENSADDYVEGIQAFAAHADFLTVNVSSPNTPGLRDMQGREALRDILQRVMAARAACGHHPKIFLKIAPDLGDGQAEDIAEVAAASQIDAIIISNTSVSRPASIPAGLAQEAGGLSGKPIFDLSTKALATIYRLTKGQIPLIGCGGISTGADAYAKIRAGASLLQIYSVMIYRGPYAALKIADELAACLKREGFTGVADAVGVDVK